MSKAFIKKFLLIIPGILLSLVLLEFSLRFAGFAISSYRQYKNNKVLKNKSQYTIMCLGESTTADQYPVQLQQILDEKYPNKFSVIDCGIPAISLKPILKLSYNNIQKYNPDIVICMMGINNGFYNPENNNKKIYESDLKIYNLYILLKQHIKSLLNSKFLFANSNINTNWIEKYMYFREQQKYDIAEEMLNLEISKNPDNQDAQAELAYFYYFFLEKRIVGYNMAKKAIDNKSNNIITKSIFYDIIFYHNKFENTNSKEFQFYIDKILNKDINTFKSPKKYWLFTQIQNVINDEQKKFLTNILFDGTNKSIEYSIAAISCLNKKNFKKAQEYFDKAEELRLNSPNTETYGLYKLIIKKLIDNNIKVICMQYPVRSVNSLKEQLKNESYFDKITFISNEENFKKALMNKNYDEIFNDQFAGDFGHCTELGNTMIAENIVNTLEKLINKKSDFKF